MWTILRVFGAEFSGQTNVSACVIRAVKSEPLWLFWTRQREVAAARDSSMRPVESFMSSKGSTRFDESNNSSNVHEKDTVAKPITMTRQLVVCCLQYEKIKAATKQDTHTLFNPIDSPETDSKHQSIDYASQTPDLNRSSAQTTRTAFANAVPFSHAIRHPHP